jgi:hypothetical protein
VFDFRYHAVSLAAVFIALVVGLLLGVAIGDANLVSNAERNLRNSLQSDLNRARSDASTLRGQLSLRAQYESAAYSDLVANRLAGKRIGLIFLGGGSDQVNGLLRTALQSTGGQLVLVAVMRDPVDPAAVSAGATGTRYAQLTSNPSLLRPFGVRIGKQLALGGHLLAQLQSALLSSYNGTLGPLDAVVVMRNTAGITGTQAQAQTTFESGLSAGLAAARVPVVGVETSSTNPSQIAWYSQQNFSSVDDLDDLAGRTALVYALAGAHGAFGLKPSAQALLPTPPAARATTTAPSTTPAR